MDQFSFPLYSGWVDLDKIFLSFLSKTNLIVDRSNRSYSGIYLGNNIFLFIFIVKVIMCLLNPFYYIGVLSTKLSLMFSPALYRPWLGSNKMFVSVSLFYIKYSLFLKSIIYLFSSGRLNRIVFCLYPRIFIFLIYGAFIFFPLTSISNYNIGALDSIIGLIQNLVKDNLGAQNYNITLNITTLFLTRLLLNLIGLIPFSLSITSSLCITFIFGACFFSYVVFNLWFTHKENSLVLVILWGHGAGRTFALFFIELISYFVRVLSLSRRLGINRMAGHLLIKLFCAFLYFILSYTVLTAVSGSLVACLLFAIIRLESLVSVLQAYVFTILVLRYFSDILSSH